MASGSIDPDPERPPLPSGDRAYEGPAGGTVPRRRLLRGMAGAAAAGALGPLAGGCASGNSAPSQSRHPAGTPQPASSRPAAGRHLADPAPLPSGLPDQIVHGPRGKPAVALTFHGQGDPAQATALLAEAERAGARLTVLVVGTWLDEQPHLARRILDGGHELGNHTLRHLDICAMNARDAYAEITGCAERLRRLTGSPGRWFRPSRARYATALVRQQAHRAGYPHCLSYDVDSLDYTDPGPAAVQRTVLGAVRGGSVVSLHLGHPGTVAALPAIVDGLRRRGLRAVTVTQMLTA